MAFKLPDHPSPQPAPHELADFAELLVIVNGRSSATEIQRFLGRLDDNENNIGIEDSDEQNEIISDAMIAELGYRHAACPRGYPFQTDDTGTILTARDDVDSRKRLLYHYLLFATRLKMTQAKVHAGFDGTRLMEELSAEVLRSYLGGARARVEVFGTAREGGFADKIRHLCTTFREGGDFRSIDEGPTRANDDGLDVVGWIPFTDDREAKLCVFAQCKTGTSWREHVYRLDPGAFITRWMSKPFIVVPVKAYFIAKAAERAQWKGVCLYAGIVFDRCRIVDCADDLSESLTQRIEAWTAAAKEWLVAKGWSRDFG